MVDSVGSGVAFFREIESTDWGVTRASALVVAASVLAVAYDTGTMFAFMYVCGFIT